MYASYFKMSKHSAILSLLQCGNTHHHIVVVVSGAFFIYQCINRPAHKAPAINSSENDVYLSRMLHFFLVTLFGFVSIEANSVDLNRTAPI